MSLTPHIEFLTSFAESHFTGNRSRDKMLRLKLDHSMRVFGNAECIIDGERMTGDIASMGRLAALYHDIGRFPQLAKYGTFNDRESVNHGRLGVLTLRDLDMPGEVPAKSWRFIRLAIGQHNVKNIRNTLPSPVSEITRLIRDADKIDIFRVMVEHFSGENPDPAITHGFEEVPGQYSETIFDAVTARTTADYRDIRCANDFKLLIVGWVYDLNYPTSVSLLKERGLVERIFSFLPKDKKIQDLEKKVNNFMHYNNGEPS